MAIRQWVFAFWVCVCSLSVFADSYLFLDFDNVVTECRQARQGTFKTPFRVFLVSQRGNVAQPLAPSEPYVDLSPWDWERLSGYLARGPMELGSVAFEARLQDGRKFRPGYYMMRNPDTFHYFLEAPASEKEGYLLQHFRDAYASDPAKRFLGMAWPILKARVLDPATLKTTGLISARGHSDEEWQEALDFLWKKEGLPSKHRIHPRNIHGMSRPEYDKYDIRWHIPLLKRGTLEKIAAELARKPLSDDDIRISPDGKSTQKMHTLVYFDDNQKTLEHISALFESLAMTRRYPIKFVIGNFGLTSEVTETRRPRFYVITKTGGWRKAKPIEIFGEPAGWTEDSLPALDFGSCSKKLVTAGENDR